MALIQGKHICEHCRRTFKWYYTTRENERNFASFSVNILPNNASPAFRKYSYRTNMDELQARCRYCDKYNIIDEDKDI